MYSGSSVLSYDVKFYTDCTIR